jgi:hypothetical protein
MVNAIAPSFVAIDEFTDISSGPRLFVFLTAHAVPLSSRLMRENDPV